MRDYTQEVSALLNEVNVLKEHIRTMEDEILRLRRESPIYIDEYPPMPTQKQFEDIIVSQANEQQDDLPF